VALALLQDVDHAALQVPLIVDGSDARRIEGASELQPLAQRDLDSPRELPCLDPCAGQQGVRVRVDQVEREQAVDRTDLEHRSCRRPARWRRGRDDPAVAQTQGDVLRDRFAARGAK
jgi:hypothetical protein